MIIFQDEPDPIFLAIVDEALADVREVHLVRYREGYRPTRAERRDLDESYRDLFPEPVPFFTRRELVRVIDRLRRASRDERRRYELTDYHWLVFYSCLQLYCDLHNDGATASGDQVGPYEIEHIDFDAMVDRFFFDTDFLMGATLLSAEEAAPGQLLVTRQAWKIAARLRPEAKDLRVVEVACSRGSEGGRESVRRVPASGYVGPYPLRERDEGEDG
ncbi:MAG TPA: hypothetical protein DD417_12185 [Elusimicrobia bacterium]|nr:MAG: hypothetical protein A2X53_11760 [Candidatus Rokubacteria bacterium GWA2_70_23]HBL17467.1 hypothetical protein [Elusimicrobiota bacterium]